MSVFPHQKKRIQYTGILLAAALSFGIPAQSVWAAVGPGAEINGQHTITASQQSEIQAIQTALAQMEAEKPEIAAQGAVLYDATHGLFLVEKNADTKYYPASITKLMTALLVAESCGLEGEVTFSETAVSKLESGAVTLKLQAGETLSVKDCMYGMMLKSANEIANGLAEHVSGSISAFTEKMTQRAKDLGCTNTNFENPNGLNNQEHVTTARDMALIAAAAYQNEIVREVTSTLTYDFPATKAVNSVRKLTMGHKMLDPTRAEYYPGIVGGKTGFTSLAGNTLVTCVEKNGVRLIAVILKSSQTHYSDTKKLLDYGVKVLEASGASSAGTADLGSSSASPDASVNGNAAVGTGNQTAPDVSIEAGGQTAPGVSVEAGGQTAPGVSVEAGNQTAAGTSTVSGSQSGSGNQQTAVGPGQQSSNTQQIIAGAVGREAFPKAEGSWEKLDDDWRFKKTDGTYAVGECLLINGEVYGFGADGMMLHEWQLVNGTWHNFRTAGNMAFSRWIETNGLWYYVDENGSLFVNGTTPDGYRVDENGVWIQ